jgi:hypothetical protein
MVKRAGSTCEPQKEKGKGKKTMAKAATTYEPYQYAIMEMDTGELAELVQENLGGETLSAGDLTRVPIPAGGATTFVIPTIDGEIETKEIEGIIIFTQLTRAYWPLSFDETGGGTPPECASFDGLTGMGNPGGNCLKCPLKEFNSGDKGRPACQEKRQIFLFQKDDFLPTLIAAPAGSLKNAKQYLTGLTARRMFSHQVYTRLTLERDKNQDGIAYSKLVFQKIGEVEDPARTKALSQKLKPFLVQAAQAAANERDGQ